MALASSATMDARLAHLSQRWERARWAVLLALGSLAGLVAMPALARAQVSGLVRDTAHQPVEGAIVTVQASTIETRTDAAGAYSLPGAMGRNINVVAAKPGHYYGFVRVSTPSTTADIEIEPVPTTSDPAYELRAPEICGNCHNELYAAWRDSPMGKAGKNTWVYDVYDGTATPGGKGGFVYTRDSILAPKNPNSECASCHEPELWWNKPYTPLDPVTPETSAIAHGVSCEVCHKIAKIDPTRPNFPGLFPGVVELSKPGGTPFRQVQFGVLGDVTYDIDTTMMKAAYQPQLKADVCAACHQDKNDPDENGNFEEDNGVISEPTFVEWRDSAYADPSSPKHATCVDCHMKPTNAAQACSMQFPPLQRPPGDVRSHAFPGTTAEFLDNAVTMTMTATKTDTSIDVAVTIDNDKTGHHVPTGVTIRNMVLLVEAFRAQDKAPLRSIGEQVIHELGGAGDPAKGYFAGLPGKLYAKVNGDRNGRGPTFFTDATSILWDTRIPPLGRDTTRYRFALPGDGGELHVRARLVYRRSWRALVDAKAWTKDGHDNELEDLKAPYFGHLMEETEQVIDLPCSADACVDGDGCGCRAARPHAAAVGTCLFGLGLACAAVRRRRR